MDGFEVFKNEFKSWVESYNLFKGYNASPDKVFTNLQSRIPDKMLRLIGEAYLNGWLETNSGYFVRETDKPKTNRGMWMLEPSNGEVVPCWEQHIQLADYRRLKEIAVEKEFVVKLEDGKMDIAVYDKGQLLLYVENKLKKSEAETLFIKMKEYGENGFDLSPHGKGNDPLKKAKYLVENSAYPQYFGLTALGFEKVFEIEYLYDNNRFLMHELDCEITGPLKEIKSFRKTNIELKHNIKANKIEIKPSDNKTNISVTCSKENLLSFIPGGSGTTHNLCIRIAEKPEIIMGFYHSGIIWTNAEALGPDLINNLSRLLYEIGIDINTKQKFPYWKKNGMNYCLQKNDVDRIINQLMKFFSPFKVSFHDESKTELQKCKKFMHEITSKTDNTLDSSSEVEKANFEERKFINIENMPLNKNNYSDKSYVDWDEALSVLFDEECIAVGKELSENGIRPPDIIGYELKNSLGEIEAMAEMIWNKERIVLLTVEQFLFKDSFEKKGWKVFLIESGILVTTLKKLIYKFRK